MISKRFLTQLETNEEPYSQNYNKIRVLSFNQGAVRRKNYYEGVLFLMFSYMKLKDEDELVRELVRLVRSSLSVRFVTGSPNLDLSVGLMAATPTPDICFLFLSRALLD